MPIDEAERQLEEWLVGRPAEVVRVARAYPPWFRYRIKEGAPYSITAPGSVVTIVSYYENGDVGVVVEESTPAGDLCVQDLIAEARRRGDTREKPGTAAGLKAEVAPEWLERLETH